MDSILSIKERQNCWLIIDYCPLFVTASILDDLCHRQFTDFSHRLSDCQRVRAIASMEDQNCDDISVDHFKALIHQIFNSRVNA